jgi:hypothetical protein
MKKGVYYIPLLAYSSWQGKEEKGLPPSEIKGQDERLAGALAFIHPLGKK